MFKLESYLTPWLLSYLDKYVKLKPEDFQLSLWGGDAVFNKLDLRLNVIENLTNIPVTFKSGVIHELRIHIPWTRITSEPVVVTINTLEFVAKLKDSKDTQQQNSSKRQTPDSTLNSSTLQVASTEQQQQQKQQQQMPSGYIQNILSKILSNMCVIVNNVIVKFVEDDIVLSFNMKSAEFYSVNDQWDEKSFVDISTDLHLRKILQLNDVTICLDKIDNKKSSRINFYQDPLIYRCSIQSRFDFIYSPATATSPTPTTQNDSNQNLFNQQLKQIKLNFYCRKFDMSITDQQLPMLLRLVELILAIVDGSLSTSSLSATSQEDLAADDQSSLATTATILQSQSHQPQLSSVNLTHETTVEQESTDPLDSNNQDQGWISWAWSYVPSVSAILPAGEYENESSVNNNNNTNNTSAPTQNDKNILIGFYFDEMNISFKLIQQLTQLNESTQQKVKSLSATHFLNVNLKGIALEANNKGSDYSNFICGISFINVKSVGECCCKLCVKPNENEKVFLNAGVEYLEEKTFHYLSSSLFDLPDTSNIPSEEQAPSARDKLGLLDENYGSTRFGAVYLDVLNHSISSNLATAVSSSDTNEQDDNDYDLDESQELISGIPPKPDISSLYLILYKIELNLSANFMHRMLKLYESSQSYAYKRPYSSVSNRSSSNLNLNEVQVTSIDTNLAGSYHEQQKLNIERMAHKFEKDVPLISYNIILKEPSIRFHPFAHFYNTQSFDYRCFFMFQVNYVSFGIRQPKYQEKLFEVVSNLINPSQKLLYDSYIHNSLTMDGFSLKWVILGENPAVATLAFPVIEPCFFEIHFSYVIMNPQMWNKEYFPFTKYVLELPNLKLNIHKQMIFIVTDYLDNYLFPLMPDNLNNLLNSFKKPNINKQEIKKTKLRQMVYKRLLEDFFIQSPYKRTEILKVCLSELKLKYSTTKLMQIVQMNLHSLNVYLFKHEQPDFLLTIVDTTSSSEFIEIKAQLPLEITGTYIPDPLFIYCKLNQITLSIKDELIDWLSYKPTRSDDELLNSLILELFDDYTYYDTNNQQKSSANLNQSNTINTVTSQLSSSSSLYKLKSSIGSSTQFSRPISSTVKKEKVNSKPSTAAALPSLIDTYYDLVKSFHLNVNIEPIQIELTHSLIVKLPKINLKSIGTKCDLDEELKTISWLVEMPCTFLRACEKTSNKLPWQIDLKNFQLTSNSNVVFALDSSAYFTLRPKYNNHNNLLHSLSVVLNIDAAKKSIDIQMNRLDLENMISLAKKLELLGIDFKYKLDYSEFEAKINYDSQQEQQQQSTNNDQEPTIESEDNKSSYSTISISKEYELVMMDQNELIGVDSNTLDEHCSLTSSENDYSSSSSYSALNQKKKKLLKHSSFQTAKTTTTTTATSKESSPILLISREQNKHDQVKLNFAFHLAIANLTLTLERMLELRLQKLSVQTELNNIFQKCEIKLKKLMLLEEIDNKVVTVLVKTEANLTGKNFLELTFTRALVSNLNKKLNQNNSFVQVTSTATTAAAAAATALNKKKKSHLIQSNQKWIVEVNLEMQNIDCLIHMRKFDLIYSFLNIFNSNRELELPITNQPLLPLVKACDMPLLNIDMNSVRIKLFSLNNIQREMLTFQMSSFSLTSQIDEPLMRNITAHSSVSIYNRAKSNNLLYMPGFAFEDRQYSFKLNGMSLSTAKATLMQSLTVNAVIGLPILLENKLINGYAIEINIPEPHFFLSNNSINFIIELLDENFPGNQTEPTQSISKEYEMLPIDLLITLENLNICLYSSDDTILPLVWMQIIQPHLCLRVHEKTQYVEFQIYDFSIKRSTPSSFKSTLPVKADFIMPLIDTRPSEQNKKTGIVPGFFSLKVNNFLLLANRNRQTTSEDPEEKSHDQIVCVCNTCLKCYELSAERTNHDLTRVDLLIERPLRISSNVLFLDQLNNFVRSLKLPAQNQDQELNALDQLKYFVSIPINFYFKSSQLVVVIDLPSLKNSVFLFSLNSLIIHSSKKRSSVHCFDLNLIDFQAKYQLQLNTQYTKFLGPFSLKLNVNFNTMLNELFGLITIGSFCLTVNRPFVELITCFNQSFKPTSPKQSLNGVKNKFTVKNKSKSYLDDLRSGLFEYIIVDKSYLKKMISNQQLNWIAHIQLPKVNEIVCVDDLDESSSVFASTVTWRYSKRRALTSLIIHPLPFIGQPNYSSSTSDQLECYLEYFNEANKKFIILKEFNLTEGVYINVLDQNEVLVYSQCWRIRFSDETKRLVYASSLLASTRVDSIEFEDNEQFSAHLELSLNNIELKLNQISNNNNSELALLNLNEFNLRLMHLNENIEQITAYGQLGIEFCEYRFLTMQPLLDPFQFKFSLNSVKEMNIRMANLNFIMSESALIALKHLEAEFLAENYSSAKAEPLAYYLIHNDTDIQLNVKQFDTEESCAIKPTECLAYSWRTHKKKQLLQIELLKYKGANGSVPFQINEKSIQQIKINLSNDCSVNLIVRVDEFKMKKKVHIEAELVVCNYLELNVDSFYLSYFCEDKIYELTAQDLRAKTRSQTTFEFIQHVSSSHLIKLNKIEINSKNILFDSRVGELSQQLSNGGLVCHDLERNAKYWLSLYEQSLNGSNTNGNSMVKQLCFVLSPLFVFCSYLPYDLNVQFCSQLNTANSLVKANTITQLFSNSSLSEKELAIRFDHVTSTSSYSQSSGTLGSNWFDLNETISLDSKTFICHEYENETETDSDLKYSKKLKYFDLFTYKTQLDEKQEDEQKLDEASLADISFNIITPPLLSSQTDQVSFSSSSSSSNSISENKFIVEKSKCWPFSKTIRIDIKPICLMLNKTDYLISLVEQNRQQQQPRPSLDLIKANGGQLCLFDLTNKKLKFSIETDEYEISKSYDLIKNTVKYESNWFEISDEQSSPFYREQNEHSDSSCSLLYANKCWIDLKLYALDETKSKLKIIYLVLQNNDWSPTTRILTIQNKFLLNNQTKFDFNLELTANPYASQSLSRVFISSTDEFSFKPNSFYSSGDLLNYSINQDQTNDDDLFYLKINSLSGIKVIQSKLILLTVREKAIKQISSSTSANAESLLISRQCFCLYDECSSKNSRAFICAQKLLIDKNDGRLLITLKEDLSHLVKLVNKLETDLFVWPRISSNFIFENYINNLNQLNSNPAKSRLFMHRIPAQSTFLFNYDFIGTNHFPIENINEQIFFMFSLADQSHISPNMCRIYDTDFLIGFEHDSNIRLAYSADCSNEYVRFICLFEAINALSTDGELNLRTENDFKLNLNIERVTVALNDDFSSEIYQTEILYLTVDSIEFEFETNLTGLSMAITCQHIQLDNQMFDLTQNQHKYDFPVVFIPRNCVNKKKTLAKSNQRVYKSLDDFRFKKQNENEEFLKINLTMDKRCDQNVRISELEMNIKPFEIYLEDYLVYNLIKIGVGYLNLLSYNNSGHKQEQDREHAEDVNNTRDLSILFEPILMVKKLRLSKIDALVSLQTSLKIYCATYKTPVIFDEMIIKGMPWSMQSSPQLVKLFTSHYLTSLLFRLGWVVGSLDLIGSPTAFIHTVSNGVYDFIRLPYRGLRDNGPTGLFSGFSHGTLSLIKNLSAGTVTSITSFSSFISRNMDILSFDPDHLARQEMLRHQMPFDSFGNSLVQISTGFIISIMGALGGLAQQPIQSVQESESFLKGVSKGIIGLVTKPVGAVAELVNQTGQGILRVTGVSRIPSSELRLQRRALNKEFSRFNISMVKCLRKLILSSSNNTTLNGMIEAVYSAEQVHSAKHHHEYNMTGCYLVLSEHTLYIIDKKEDILLRAFHLSQIDISIRNDVLVVELHVADLASTNNISTTVAAAEAVVDSTEVILSEYEKIYENTFDRLVDFVEQASAVAAAAQSTNKQKNTSTVISFNFKQDDSIILMDYYRFERIDYLNFLKQYNGLPCTCGSMLNSLSLANALSSSSAAPVELTNKPAATETLTGYLPKVHRIKSSEGFISENNKTTITNTNQQFVYYIDPRLADNFVSIFKSLKRKLLNKGFQF